jgi:putative ABC transport system permease protein
MRPLHILALRLRSLFKRRAVDRELGEEFGLHFDAQVSENLARGMSPAEARSAAMRAVGNIEKLKEDCRDMRRVAYVANFLQDCRYALRKLRHEKAFTVSAVMILALALGANALIFSLVNGVLLRPLPYPEDDRLVVVRFTPPNQPDQRQGTNAFSFLELRDRSTVFESLGAARLNPRVYALEGPNDTGAEQLQAQWITPGLTRVLRVNPLLGVWPGQTDEGLIVISHNLWQRLFGGAPDVIGKKVSLDVGVLTVAGVTPPGFEILTSGTEFWFFQTDSALRTGGAYRSPNRIFTLFGRLKPGVTLTQAQSEMNSLALGLAEAMPEMNRGWGIRVESLRDVYVGRLRKPLLVFQGAVLFVLLIACANVAGLLLAQAVSRQKELAMRAALGSGRGRIASQLLTQSLLLSLLGGALGIALAWAGLRIFGTMWPDGFPRVGPLAVDWSVLGFALLLALGTGLVFGVLPALQVSRPDLMEVLRQSTRAATSSGAPQRLRNAFVVVQVSLALVLLLGAGLTINSLLRLNAVQAGFDPHHVLTFQVPFPNTFYSIAGTTPAGGFQLELSPRIHLLSERIRQRVGLLPGAESAALTVTPPLGGDPPRMKFSRAGHIVNSSEQEVWTAEWYPVGLDYFRTLRLPLLRGREFGTQDSDTGRPVAIINQTMARSFWPAEDPIGKQLQLDLLYDPPREIVGIAGDVWQNRYQHDAQPQLYVPRIQLPHKMDMTLTTSIMTANTFLVRTKGDPAQLVSALRAAVAEVDRTQVVTRIRTVEDYASGQLQELREYAALLSVFGGMSLALTVIGIFGIVAHAVSQRTSEIGIRVALGARSGDVVRLIVRQGLVLIAIGLGLGLVASLFLTRALQSFLWGITATDTVTFTAVALVLAFVGALACYLPARRALKIDPITALRCD